MDDIDRQLIALLRENARTRGDAGQEAAVARGTVQNRLAKLEADGTVVGYTVRLRPQVEEQRIRALMTVAVEGNKAEAVLKALRGDPAVGALYSTNGRWDIVAELRADSLEAFDRVLGRIRLHRRHLEHRDQPAALDPQAVVSGFSLTSLRTRQIERALRSCGDGGVH